MIAALAAAAVLVLPPVPGATNPDVTQATAAKTVCVPGWSKTIRPPVTYTSKLKRELLTQQHLPGSVRDYQLDHLVSLSVGGAPRARENLWMQPAEQARPDDRLELELHKAVCAGVFTLREGQRLELAYKRVYG